jgi:hypothetical protein
MISHLARRSRIIAGKHHRCKDGGVVSGNDDQRKRG